MKTAHLIVAAALALASAASLATTCKNGGTNWPTCTPPSTPSVPSTSTNTLSSSSGSTSSAEASANAAASASLSGSMSAGGGAGGSASLADWSRQNMYVLPAPVNAAPLPPGMCPQGDSLSWSIAWNFFSYASSSTRTELACLVRVLDSLKSAPTVHVIQAPTLPPAAVSAPASVAAMPTKEKAKAKRKPAPIAGCMVPKNAIHTTGLRQGPCQGA